MTTETPTDTRFSEVKGLTDRPRLPRLGKIHLGIRDQARGFPRATDFFVVPDVIQSVYGAKPRELDVVFPSDDVALVAPAAWKNYTATRGKVCTGDGERAVRLVDDDKLKGLTDPTQQQLDDAIASKDATHVSRRAITCPAHDCVFAQRKVCKAVLNLQFLLPKVPGIGVWQLDTGSINSILDVRGGIELVMQLSGGKLAGIPLKLRLEPLEVISPEDQKKKLVHTLKLISPATLGKVLMAGERNLRELLMADDGSGRSVGLPALGVGQEVPPPHEPEEDLYPRETIEMPASRGGSSAAESPPQGSQEERGRSTAEVVGSSPTPRSDLEKDLDLSARIYELFKELGVEAKDRGTYERAYKGRERDLVKFLEANLAKRKPKS